MLNIAVIIIILVAFQRLSELFIANKNTKRLLSEGAQEYGQAHYPFFILLHSSWLIACLYYAILNPMINWVYMILFIIMQLGRLWVLLTLGKYWTTRIISLNDVPLVKKGPYRFVSHPNYIVVACELFLLPMALGQWWLSILFTILNIPLTYHRIRVEESVISHRRR